MIKNKKTIKKFSNRTYVVAIVILVLALVGGTWGYLNLKSQKDEKKRVAMETCNSIVPITVSKDVEAATATDATGVERLARINAIYDSFKLGSEFKLTDSNVFGDKKIYEWDNGRSFSSVKYYEKCADVNQTANQLRDVIQAAGFKYFDEPYPGSASIQYHFKSEKNEYVRMSVYNAENLNTNDGPSSIILKVNLDDNNE